MHDIPMPLLERHLMCVSRILALSTVHLPSSPKLTAKKIEPLLDAIAYHAVAIFCNQPRPAILGPKGATPMKRNARP